MIVGIDEVGRGAWAGPLCVGAVALGDTAIQGLTDSKKLSAKKRDFLSGEIKKHAAGVGLGWVSAKQIDTIGLSAALKLAAERAVRQITVPYDQVIVDGTIQLLDDPRAVTMKQADLLVPSVSAASIVAKVARDRYMQFIASQFSDYGFEGHVGYGTAAHMAAITQYGPCSIHRMSFKPLTESEPLKVKRPMTQTAGQYAEDRAAVHLKKQKFTIVDQNWKTRWCEIDIIAMKKDVIYFVEVKYRKNDKGGRGFAAITPKKLKRMTFAAELWLSRHAVKGAMLAAVEVHGDEFEISQFITIM